MLVAPCKADCTCFALSLHAAGCWPMVIHRGPRGGAGTPSGIKSTLSLQARAATTVGPFTKMHSLMTTPREDRRKKRLPTWITAAECGQQLVAYLQNQQL